MDEEYEHLVTEILASPFYEEPQDSAVRKFRFGISEGGSFHLYTILFHSPRRLDEVSIQRLRGANGQGCHSPLEQLSEFDLLDAPDEDELCGRVLARFHNPTYAGHETAQVYADLRRNPHATTSQVPLFAGVRYNLAVLPFVRRALERMGSTDQQLEHHLQNQYVTMITS